MFFYLLVFQYGFCLALVRFYIQFVNILIILKEKYFRPVNRTIKHVRNNSIRSIRNDYGSGYNT